MGAICGPPLDGLCETIARECGVATFIETGTHRGNAVRWAATRFKRVVTMEAVHEMYAATREACRGLANVEFHHGDSATFLATLVPTLTEPCLFCLDAHAGGGYFGDCDVCPLLAEIAAINLSPLSHYVVIDDAIIAVPPAFRGGLQEFCIRVRPALP